MSIGSRGENLIFLISQPRAGSTLLQMILGNHPDIHTVSEPWLMLHPVYAMRSRGYHAEYNTDIARNALQSFIHELPAGEEDYLESIRCAYAGMYNKVLALSGKQYFLDKTPRYYFIIPELYRIFPKASYIILYRNPLSVLYSILTTWVKENWFRLWDNKTDLLLAPKLLVGGKSIIENRCSIVYYEQLVIDPEKEIRRICDLVDVHFVPTMIDYGLSPMPQWQYGDQHKVREYKRPVPQNVPQWIDGLDDPQIWRLINDYLQFLGQDILDGMGYSYKGLRQTLNLHLPHKIPLKISYTLKRLMEKPESRRNAWEYSVLRLYRFYRRLRIQRIKNPGGGQVVHD